MIHDLQYIGDARRHNAHKKYVVQDEQGADRDGRDVGDLADDIESDSFLTICFKL